MSQALVKPNATNKWLLCYNSSFLCILHSWLCD